MSRWYSGQLLAFRALAAQAQHLEADVPCLAAGWLCDNAVAARSAPAGAGGDPGDGDRAGGQQSDRGQPAEWGRGVGSAPPAAAGLGAAVGGGRVQVAVAGRGWLGRELQPVDVAAVDPLELGGATSSVRVARRPAPPTIRSRLG